MSTEKTRVKIELLSEGEQNTPAISISHVTLRGASHVRTLSPASLPPSVIVELDEATDVSISQAVAMIGRDKK